MSWAAWLNLCLFHLVYSIYLAVWSVHIRWFNTEARSLADTRDKTPTHIALTLMCEEDKVGDISVKEAFVTCAERAAAWCKAAGIHRLTVYDRHGILLGASDTLKQRLSPVDHGVELERSKPVMVYPLTPPSSDDSDSQFSGEESTEGNLGLVTVYPEHPEHEIVRKAGRSKGSLRRRGSRKTSMSAPSNVVVQVASQTAGKSMVVSVANKFLRSAQQNSDHLSGPDAKGVTITVADLQYILEGEKGLLPPDLMIVHHVTCPSRQRPPMELQAFPPWQIRLTEFFYDGSWSLRARLLHHMAGFLTPYSLLTELDFRKALDEYSSAQFRVGR